MEAGMIRIEGGGVYRMCKEDGYEYHGKLESLTITKSATADGDRYISFDATLDPASGGLFGDDPLSLIGLDVCISVKVLCGVADGRSD